MTLPQIARQLDLEALNPRASLDPVREVGQAHASDLLSDVLANAPAGGLLLTIQVHMNVIAVSLHAGLSAVIFTSGLSPEEAVREKAAAEGLPLFATRESTFEVAGKLYALGLRGRHE
jgi:predicted transcriptional regulator